MKNLSQTITNELKNLVNSATTSNYYTAYREGTFTSPKGTIYDLNALNESFQNETELAEEFTSDFVKFMVGMNFSHFLSCQATKE